MLILHSRQKASPILKTYGTVYITCDNGTAHIFTLIQDEVFYGSAETNDFEDIVSSLQSK